MPFESLCCGQDSVLKSGVGASLKGRASLTPLWAGMVEPEKKAKSQVALAGKVRSVTCCMCEEQSVPTGMPDGRGLLVLR